MLAGHDVMYVRAVWTVASLFGVLAIVVLAVLYRRAARRHELEHAERVITEHDHELALRSESPRSSSSSPSSSP